MNREKLSLRAILIPVVLAIASLLLIHTPQIGVSVSAQVGADKRPTPTPKKSTPKPRTKPHTTPRPASTARPTPTPLPTPSPTPPRQTAPEIELVLIPAGTFTMGSPDSEQGRSNDEGPQHRVTVQQFYMGKYEVTKAQYRAVMETNSSDFEGDNLPVENVSWNDTVEFCRKLSQMTGKEYRLPSEAEWEYACRAGTSGSYAGDLDSMAWYSNNSGSQMHPVGQKQPNAFGLYDMHGNVWEWCQDWYHKSYNGAPIDGSAWESGGGQYRVLRGGSWDTEGVALRSAYRASFKPVIFIGFPFGFRVVAVSRS